MIDNRFSQVVKKTDCEFYEDIDIAKETSSGIHAIAKVLVYPDSYEKIIELIRTMSYERIPFFVVGNMTNVLLKDAVYNGVIIKTTNIKRKNVAENAVELSCGERLQGVIRYFAEKDLGGMEGLYGIPGTVGGMVRQNAGAFGYEISNSLIEAVCYFPSRGEVLSLSREEMLFSYRTSILEKESAVLLAATFKFTEKKKNDVLDEIYEYRQKRLKSQPYGCPSLGSIFKRCDGVSAGYYIDKVGMKGVRIGGAEVSKKHAGFIINVGNATSADYLALIEQIKQKVHLEFGIRLKEEIVII